MTRIAEEDVATLVARIEEPLEVFLRRVLQREDLVEEALQDTLLTAIDRLARGRLGARPLAAALGIAWRGALRLEAVAADVPWHLPETRRRPGHPEGASGIPSVRAWLERGLASLGQRDRALLHLRYAAGLGLWRIAGILELTPGTTRLRLALARRRLRRVLRKRAGPHTADHAVQALPFLDLEIRAAAAARLARGGAPVTARQILPRRRAVLARLLIATLAVVATWRVASTWLPDPWWTGNVEETPAPTPHRTLPAPPEPGPQAVSPDRARRRILVRALDATTRAPVPGARVATDGAGRVGRPAAWQGTTDLRGELRVTLPPSGRLRVAAAGFGQRSLSVADPEQSILEVPMQRTGQLAGGVRPLPGVPLEQLRPGLVRPGAAPRQWIFQGRLQADGRLDWRGVPCGTWDLLLVSGADHVVLRLPRVIVRHRIRSRDPRLEALDLAGLVRPLLVSVRGADGRPVPGALVELGASRPKDPDMPSVRTGADGFARCAAPPGPVRVTVRAAGWLAAGRDAVGDGCAITLEPAPVLTVELELAGLTLPAGVRLGLAMVASDGRPPPACTRKGGRRFAITCQRATEVTLALSLERVTPPRAFSRIALPRRPRVTLDPARPSAYLRLELPRAALLEALARLP